MTEWGELRAQVNRLHAKQRNTNALIAQIIQNQEEVANWTWGYDARFNPRR